MERILVLLAVVTIASVVAVACGDDDGDPDSGPISGVGPVISIGEVFTTNLKGPLLINGLLYIDAHELQPPVSQIPNHFQQLMSVAVLRQVTIGTSSQGPLYEPNVHRQKTEF